MSTIQIDTTVRRGFSLPCLRCGEKGTVQVALEDVTGTEESFHCTSCEESWSGEQVRAIVGKWAKALAWLDSAPVIENDDE